MTVKIYVDAREQDPPIDKYLNEGFDVITGANLKVGDYYITDGEEEVYIELKKGQDFFSSIFDGRKLSQLADLARYPNSYYVMIGDPFDGYYLEYTPIYFQSAYPESIVSSIASVGKRHENGYRVGFYNFPTMYEFEYFVLYQATRMKKGKLYHPAITGEELRRLRNRFMLDEIDIDKIKKIGVLMQADTIGYEKAKKLIEHFNNSAEAVLRASDKALMEVWGIGKKAVEEIRKLGFAHD